MKLVLLSVGLLLIAVLLLGVKVFFVKGGKFRSGHISGNPHMKKRGIGGAKDL